MTSSETTSTIVKLRGRLTSRRQTSLVITSSRGQPTAERPLMVWLSSRKLVTGSDELAPVQGGAEGTE